MSDTTSEPDVMRAVVHADLGSPQALELRQVPKPVPLPTEVLVRVHAAGVNPVDWKTAAGAGTVRMLGAPVPVLGWDVAGVVEAVGFGVTTLAAGDAVFGMPWFPRPAGAYADYVTAPSRQFAVSPPALSHEQAAALPLAGLTAWQALVDTADVGPGDRVLVHAAAGGVGHLAVQFAKARGASVIGTARAERHTWLRELGVDEPVDHTAVPTEATARDVDVVLDLVGGDVAERSLPTLRPGGLVIAVPAGVSPALQAAADAAGVRASALLVEPDGHALAQIAELVESGAVRVEVERVFALGDAAAAHAHGQRGHTRGKLVLRTGA